MEGTKKRGSLKTVLVAVILTAVIITAGVITSFTIFNTIKTNNESTEAYSSRLLDDVKSQLRYETEEAMSICEVMYGRYQAGEMTLAEAKKESADIIRELRYNEGSGYFWVDTSDGTNVVLLGRDTEGQSRWDLTDSSGNKFIQQMIENGLQEGGGYTQLMFAKPNETEELPKINYTAYYEPFDWVMGTGVWIDDLEALEKDFISHQHQAMITSVVQTIIILLVLIVIGAFVAFCQHYINTGKLPKEMGRLFSQLETMRENSDYNCVYEVSKAELADQLAPAKEMIDTIARMVKE